MRLYPADHYALFIGNHGFGWKGFGISDHYADSIMYLPELARVLREARYPIDLLLLDACHMNMAETITELIGTGVNYVLASETYGEIDWPYGSMLDGLMSNPTLTPRDFISDMNERLWTYYSETHVVETITLCTTDLSLTPDFVSNTAQFVSGVMDTNVPFSTVQQHAQVAITSLSNLFVVCHLGPYWNDIAHGLAVYFPVKEEGFTPESFDEYTFRRTRFALDAGWRALLDDFYDPIEHPPFHHQLMDIRLAITNYLDYGGGPCANQHIDLYDFLRRFVEWEE